MTTTSWVGAIGVRPARTMKVTKADSSASADRDGASQLAQRRPLARLGERRIERCVLDVSALVMLAMR